MDIILIGTGKMGQAVEKTALAAGHTILLRIDSSNRQELESLRLHNPAVAIEFTRPEAAVDNLLLCLEAGIPVVCGTTGWQDRMDEVQLAFKKKGGSLLTASNFSIGVQLMFRLNQQLAAWMNKRPDYSARISESHHPHKLDKPSGTALTLAGDILQLNSSYNSWILANENMQVQSDQLPVQSHRIPDAIGEHVVTWESEIDELSIRHVAHNRDGFARGAVLAAEWLQDQKGFFSMEDVLFGPKG
jgi:4-hydroxy-tetrahydrodipicolinate reductase